VIAVDRQTGSDTFGQVIACDLGDVHRVHELTRDGISGVIHCGAHSGPMVARDNPYSMVQVNIVGTANVLEVARVHKATRFIYCSSTSAYGPTPPGPVPEDVTMRPSTIYGASKVAGEQLVSTYASQYELNGTSLRLSWVYGPRRTTDCVIRTMITDAQAGRPTRVEFGRDFPRQYIHVNDAAAALVMAFDKIRGAAIPLPAVPTRHSVRLPTSSGPGSRLPTSNSGPDPTPSTTSSTNSIFRLHVAIWAIPLATASRRASASMLLGSRRKTPGSKDYSMEIFSLVGRTAFVTGGNSGIGRAIVELFAAHGAKIGIGQFQREAPTAELVLALKAKGADVSATECDVSSEESVAAAKAWCAEHLGPVDILVNCAGIGGDSLRQPNCRGMGPDDRCSSARHVSSYSCPFCRHCGAWLWTHHPDFVAIGLQRRSWLGALLRR